MAHYVPDYLIRGRLALSESSYPPEFVTNLEMQWGVGFLSPGGPEEVLGILRGIDVAGKDVLDIGCGTGGPDIVIGKALNPSRIVGVDIEPYLVEKGLENISSAGLGNLINIQLIEVGSLPFADQTFDVVFSKDALIHVADKSALYTEVLRVLKPGGVFAASDWLRSANADSLDGYNEWRSLTAHDFSMQTDSETRAEMNNAGLVQIETRDRNAWYTKTAGEEVLMMKGREWRESFVQAFGEESYAKKLALRIANARAAECGGLRPTHLFGYRPK
jgi:SAM-dependent methyltransferase